MHVRSCLVIMATVLLPPGSAHADPAADVLAANTAFEQATSRLDLAAIDAAWVHDGSATVVHPSSKEPVVGWDQVRRTWEAFVTRYAEVSLATPAPQVRVSGDTAWVVGVEDFHGKRTSGEVSDFKVLTTNIFVLRDGKWLLAHHHGSRMP